jgi:flagellar biosynthesis/type III secretory pathway protein FliH
LFRASIFAIRSEFWVVFSVENAGESWEALQRAVDRIAAIVQADPNKERIDRIVTRWLKRHLHRLGAEVNLDRINSLVEDKAMLAENIENLLKKERLEARQEGRLEGRLEGRQEGRQEGRLEGRQEEAQKILRKQISLKFGDLPTWAQQRLEQATPDQLKDWSAAILVADSLESLLGEH